MSPGIRALKFVYIAIAFFCFFLSNRYHAGTDAPFQGE